MNLLARKGSSDTHKDVRAPKTCAAWTDVLQVATGSVRRSTSAGPVLARPEVG
jgi:hypothetical protein